MARVKAPLEGIVVADFSRILAGPLCTMLLGDWGARVIKVEEPGRGDETRRWGPPFIAGESAYFLSINRNKESLTLDLKSSAGREVARRLIKRADVVVENFRSEQRRKFGLTWNAVRRLNPRAILCSISGFDPDSADAEQPGYDLLAQAGAGLMWITGDPGGAPTKVGVALSDVLTAHYAFSGILGALLQRIKTKRGVPVEVSLFGATAASLINVAQNYLLTGSEANRYGNAHPSIVPYQAFEASDRTFVLAVATDRHFELLCAKVLERPELAQDQRYRNNAARVRNRGTLIPLLQQIFRKEPAERWVEASRSAGIPAAVVAGLREIFEQNAALVRTFRHPAAGQLPMVRNPVRLSSKHLPVRTAPPLLGQHTDAILTFLGFTKRQIAALRNSSVI